jgi:hypothetical protein
LYGKNNRLWIIGTALVATLLVGIISAESVTAKIVTSNGYTFNVPAGWKVKPRDNRFTSVDDLLTYNKGGQKASIQIEHGEAFASADVDLLEQVIGKVYEESSIFESGDNNTDYTVNNETLTYAIAHITEKNLFGFSVDSVALLVVVPLGDSDGLLVQYKTGEKNFDKLLPQVKQIIQSIKQSSNTLPI